MKDYKDDNAWLMLGDCLERMKEIPDGSVDCVITSPPYAKQRDYNGAESKDYNHFLLPIIKEASNKLKDDGSIFINIKEHCKDGQRDLYVYKLVIAIVEDLGLRFVEEFIWNKTNPFPTGNKSRLKDGFERVLQFTKSKKYKFYPENVLVESTSKWLESEKKRKNKGEHNVTNGSGMNMSKRVATDMVRPSNVITGAASSLNIGHPAVFPVYLPEFFIKLTTSTGDTILDTFSGSGTTGVACKNLNRKYIGIEMDETYFSIGKERVLGESK